MGSTQSRQNHTVDPFPGNESPSAAPASHPKAESSKPGFLSSWRMDGNHAEQRAAVAEAERNHLLSSGQGKIDNPYINVMPADAVGKGTSVGMMVSPMNYNLGKKRQAELRAAKVEIPDIKDEERQRD